MLNLDDKVLQGKGKVKTRRSSAFDRLWRWARERAHDRDLFDPPPPDLTLLFERQARGAQIPEPMIQAVLGFYSIAPELNAEQLHQLALWGLDQFEQGIAVGEGARRHQQGE